MGVQVVSSQGQSSGVKTDGAFMPRIFLSGFLLVSVVSDSAFPGLQTSVRRGTVPVYSAPSAAALATRVFPPLGDLLLRERPDFV